MWRYKKIGLNISCYSRVEVLFGTENGSEVLYVNFDNPIRIMELTNPDRIGIELLSGQSYSSGRGNMESFHCIAGSTLMDEFLGCLGNANTAGSLVALPGANSPVTSYMEVADFGDHYGINVVYGSTSIGYRLEKSDSELSEMNRKTVNQSELIKPHLEVMR